MDSFAKARSLNQGIILLVVCCAGVLGFAAHVSEGDIRMAAMFGIVTPLGFALGIWLIRRALAGGQAAGAPGPADRRADA